jgi:hypothetical protein
VAVVLPVPRRLLSGYARKARPVLAKFLRPARAPLANLAQVPLTFCGFACLAAAALWWNPVAGLACTGVLLIVLEHVIADDGTSR